LGAIKEAAHGHLLLSPYTADQSHQLMLLGLDDSLKVKQIFALVGRDNSNLVHLAF
jgi:hypothetical protein